jgi:hypothetical protein
MADNNSNYGNTSEIVTQLGSILRNQSVMVQTLQAISTTLASLVNQSVGTFTMTATATRVVSDVNVAADSFIDLMPTNATAGTLMGGTRSLYVSSRSAGVSFTVATASAVAAAGTETFAYRITNSV